MRANQQQPFALEPTNRLSNRRAAHAKGGAQLRFDEPRAGFQVALQYRLIEGVVDLIVDRAVHNNTERRQI